VVRRRGLVGKRKMMSVMWEDWVYGKKGVVECQGIFPLGV